METDANVVYRQRRSMVGLAAGLNGLIVGIVSGLVIRFILPKGTLVALLFGGLASLYVCGRVIARGRRRTLTVTDDGLEAQRDSFRLIVRWTDFESAHKRTTAGLRTDVLTFRKGQIIPIASTGKPTNIKEDRIRKAGADRVIQVGVYVKDWRTTPIADRVQSASFKRAT